MFRIGYQISGDRVTPWGLMGWKCIAPADVDFGKQKGDR
jgi:hypothetical protein